MLLTFLFVLQLLVGAYMYSFVLGAGQRSSNARATRIPDLVAFVHPIAALVTFSVWIAYLTSGHSAYAWATFAAVLLTAGGGAVMAIATMRGSRYVDRPEPRRGVIDPGDPSEVRVAEKQIPLASIALHGGTFLVLAIGTLLVALGVVD